MHQTFEIFWWTLSILLMVVGLCGAIFPVIPDSLLILGGAVLQHFTVSDPHKVGWWTLGIMAVLCVLAHLVDFAAGMMGTRRFGGSRWGALGGFIGAIVGLSFFPIGIFVGPVVGVICAEVILARRGLGPAVKSGWGSLLGTTAGIIGKVVIDVAMIAVFALSALKW